MRKKGFAVFAVMLLMSSSLTAQHDDCMGYAIRATAQEEINFGSFSNDQEMLEVFSWYLDLCNEAGGASNSIDPVFL